MTIYLDNASTSYPKPDVVINKMSYFMKNIGATAGRGAYKNAIEAEKLVFNCRKKICELFNGTDPQKVIFTSNITESLNLVINGLLNQGDHVIISSLEHNSVRRPLKTLERDKGIQISMVPCTAYGITDPNDVEKLIRANTKLIVFTNASSVIGTIQPIGGIGKIARKHNIPLLVDTAQTAGTYPIDIVKDNINYLAFTGHKSLLGPTGTGGLLINCDTNMTPLKVGGTGGDSKNPYQPEGFPTKYESGTLNVAGVIGLGEALNYISTIGVDKIRKQAEELTEYALKKLSEIDGIKIYGPREAKKIIGVISINIKSISAEEVAQELDYNYDIAVRTGLHCAPTTHSLIGTLDRGAIRIGIGYFNKKKHINVLVKALKNISAGSYTKKIL